MDARTELAAFLVKDLIGPAGGDTEILTARPSDQYLTGILYAKPGEKDAEARAEQDDDRDTVDEDDGSPGDAIATSSIKRPNMMGISFAIRGRAPRVKIDGSAGRYVRRERTKEGKIVAAPKEDSSPVWVREHVEFDGEFPVTDRLAPHAGPHGLRLWIRAIRSSEEDGATVWQVTVAVTNENEEAKERDANESLNFFQVGFRVRPLDAVLVSRRSRQAVTDEDGRTNEVIYRKAREWAVGHTCGATWPDGVVDEVQTTWLPSQPVRATSAAGHRYFRDVGIEVCGNAEEPFDADSLASVDLPRLKSLLSVVPVAYRRWLDDQERSVSDKEGKAELAPDLAARARLHIADARQLADRMERGVLLLQEDPVALEAFRLAQRAMCIQRRWGSPKKPQMSWRPFQLAFQLLTLRSIARPKLGDGRPDPERETMDLLWFPTGGGKTEAYLGLTAFTILHRRLRHPEAADDGAGVGVLMRYTLRLLTVQQFERAARLVLACEYLRRTVPDGQKRLGTKAFSVGLWVGSAATPNRLEDAEKEAENVRQLARCPACGTRDRALFVWDVKRSGTRLTCKAPTCDLRTFDRLGVWTVDEEIYAEKPSLVIGTIDKFAQIVRKEETASLLGSAGGKPPDLIIQDELHLISGPLGTIAGIYEAAVDLICTRDGIPPKVVGSTATIRRASEQVRQLFNRQVLQFPPPVLDIEDSCFAVIDDEAPGSLYVGVTSAGRSPKFTLQAVCACLMQGAFELPGGDAAQDPYWTLVAYFNSLRELGGALVMMRDDVEDSMKNFARIHGTSARSMLDFPMELTSRVDSKEIPERLVRLEVRRPEQDIDAVLATNMISVGVDIPRLGLMAVNGQPKSMAEYIQATSRVGRGDVAGLVVTVYNVGRPRDRSHFEAFRTWHQTLYREVEASSVTPFAPRARDRALHAAIVALARHRVPALRSKPSLTEAARAQLEPLVDALVARVRNVDAPETDEVRAEASAFLSEWQTRAPGLKDYWNDTHPARSLLVSMETVATALATEGDWRWPARGTPNSMRNVEPETSLRMADALATPGGGTP